MSNQLPTSINTSISAPAFTNQALAQKVSLHNSEMHQDISGKPPCHLQAEEAPEHLPVLEPQLELELEDPPREPLQSLNGPPPWRGPLPRAPPWPPNAAELQRPRGQNVPTVPARQGAV